MKILDVSVDQLTLDEACARLNKPQVIFTPNPEILLEAKKNKPFRQALKEGTLMLPDGHGLQWASTLLKVENRFLRVLLYLPSLLLFLVWKKPFQGVFQELIHGSDFMVFVIEWADRNQKSVFFLGGRGDSAEKTALYFKKRYSSLQVAGVSNEDPNEKAFKQVRASKAQVLFVAYGAPKQELWIAKYHRKFPDIIHVMAVGGSFDFWSGNVQRAPYIFQKLGLEWTWRLMKHPWTRLLRIWNAVLRFPLQIIFNML